MYVQDLLNGVKLWKSKNKVYKEKKELLLLFEQYEDDSYDVTLWVKEDMSHGVIYTFPQISSELRAKSLHKEIKMILEHEFPNHTFVEDDEIVKMPITFRLAI